MVDLFTGKDDKPAKGTAAAKAEPKPTGPAAERGQPAPGGDKPFPNLASVPERPQSSTTAERREIAEGLVADRSRARYSSEVIKRQGEPTEVLRPSAPPTADSPLPPPPPTAAAIPPTTVAAAAPPPPSATMTTSARTPGATVAEVYRDRLAQRLPQSEPASTVPANALAPDRDGGGFPTVVVSSGGVAIESQGTAPRVSVATMPGQSSTRFLAETPAPVTGRGLVQVATIYFANGSAELDPHDRQILDAVVRLQRSGGGQVRVVGHSSSRTRTMDPVRHNMVNFNVSAARADAVARQLAAEGIPAKDIAVSARADANPVYFEVMPSGEAGNRRTDIFIAY